MAELPPPSPTPYIFTADYWTPYSEREPNYKEPGIMTDARTSPVIARALGTVVKAFLDGSSQYQMVPIAPGVRLGKVDDVSPTAFCETGTVILYDRETLHVRRGADHEPGDYLKEVMARSLNDELLHASPEDAFRSANSTKPLDPRLERQVLHANAGAINPYDPSMHYHRRVNMGIVWSLANGDPFLFNLTWMNEKSGGMIYPHVTVVHEPKLPFVVGATYGKQRKHGGYSLLRVRTATMIQPGEPGSANAEEPIPGYLTIAGYRA